MTLSLYNSTLPPQFQSVTRSVNHRDLEKRCHEDAHAIKRAPETTRIVAISRKGNPPITNKGSRYFSRACMRNRHKYGADGKKYQFKGGLFTSMSTSPEASRPRLTAEHSQRNRCPGARSFHGLVRRRSRCPRCSRAGGRAICTCVGTSPFSAPFSAPSYLQNKATQRSGASCYTHLGV
jgi:hypothetical protein